MSPSQAREGVVKLPIAASIIFLNFLCSVSDKGLSVAAINSRIALSSFSLSFGRFSIVSSLNSESLRSSSSILNFLFVVSKMLCSLYRQISFQV